MPCCPQTQSSSPEEGVSSRKALLFGALTAGLAITRMVVDFRMLVNGLYGFYQDTDNICGHEISQCPPILLLFYEAVNRLSNFGFTFFLSILFAATAGLGALFWLNNQARSEQQEHSFFLPKVLSHAALILNVVFPSVWAAIMFYWAQVKLPPFAPLLRGVPGFDMRLFDAALSTTTICALASVVLESLVTALTLAFYAFSALKSIRGASNRADAGDSAVLLPAPAPAV